MILIFSLILISAYAIFIWYFKQEHSIVNAALYKIGKAQQDHCFSNSVYRKYQIIKSVLETANQSSCKANHLFISYNTGYLLSVKHNCLYSYSLLNRELITINPGNIIKFRCIKNRMNFGKRYNCRIIVIYGSVGTEPLIINLSTEKEYRNWYTFLTQILEEKEKTKISINGDNNIIQVSKGLSGYNKIYCN